VALSLPDRAGDRAGRRAGKVAQARRNGKAPRTGLDRTKEDALTIRPYRPADATALPAIYHAAVTEIGARFYTAEQIAAWAALAPSAEDFAAQMADGRTRLVAVDAGDRPVAFADLTTGGLFHYLYAHPAIAGTGRMSRLYDALEAAAISAGITHLTAQASEAALGFFSRKGFDVVERRDFEVGGVAIHNYAAEKRLG
jgi:putative acetyltransferase